MIVLINGSARPAGTSRMLADYFARRLDETRRVQLMPNGGNTKEVLETVRQGDTIVLIGPCYINTWPAEVIGFLEKARETGVFSGKKVYGFIQGGMPYPHTHASALRTLALFCDEAGADYRGGFVMGGGAMLDGKDLSQIIGAKTMVPAVHGFIDCIRRGEKAPPSLYEQAVMPMPVPMAWALSKMMNRSLKKRMRERGIDPKTPSPYRS